MAIADATSLPAGARAKAAEDQMPPGIPFIIANEFAERFCFYGINAILAVYMTQNLHFGQAQATEWQSLFKFAAYFFPLIGAILADVFWGKFRTIMVLAAVYCAGCIVIALDRGPTTLALGLLLMAFGTGGIKPCVSTNVGDQFTTKNQHLIERAFSYFYLSINAGSSISIYFCPVWLESYGPAMAFGIPAAMMFLATLVFWLGRHRFVVVPPAMTQGANRGLAMFALALVPVLGLAVWVFNTASPDYRTIAALLTVMSLLVLMIFLSLKSGLRNALPAELRVWMEEVFTGAALKQILSLAGIYYVFIAVFWSLWDQSNGQTWTLQATSDLMDKHLFGFLAGVPVLGALASYEMLPSQVQVVNGLLVLVLVPIYTFVLYPAIGKLFPLTPLRKIGIGLWLISGSFIIVAVAEDRIMRGETVSLWWQILAYVVLTASEVMISITALEFSYNQAPLKVKSFIMAATYLLSVSFGNAFTAQVNSAMVEPLAAVEITTGTDTWVGLADVSQLQPGQKIDFGGDNGIEITDDDGQPSVLGGTFLIAEIDGSGNRVRLADAIHNRSVVSSGVYKPESSTVSTYKLVGPMYFLFFAALGALASVFFIFVAKFYKERTYVRPAESAA
ncbi:MAG: MFS transporter [Rhodospirillaceae bacterium]|nr:MFS transporter [Rhodospirillaceae bacterium]